MTINQIESSTFPVQSLVNGDNLTIQAIRIRGKNKGPKVTIQANVHGAEVQGNGVIYKLLDFFKNTPLNGSITLIPFANPMGVNHKTGTFTQGRFNPMTGNNWNRNYTDITKHKGFDLNLFMEEMQSKYPQVEPNTEIEANLIPLIAGEFKSFLLKCLNKEHEDLKAYGVSGDRHLNLILQKLSAPSDIVLDLHTGPVATRYLYAADYAKELVKDFPFPFVLLIPNEFDGAMDEASFMPWVKFNQFLKNNDYQFSCPFEAYTVELGSEEVYSQDMAKEDCARVLNFLGERGLFDKKALSDVYLPKTEIKACLLENYKTYYAPQGGLYDFKGEVGSFIKKGEVLAELLKFRDLNSLENLSSCHQRVSANEDCYIINRNPSAALPQGSPLYQVMEKVFSLQED